MTSGELPSADRRAEFESRLLDLLDEYGPDEARAVKKGIRRKHIERSRDAIRLEYALIKDQIGVILGFSEQFSRSDAEQVVASAYPELGQPEVAYHAYAVIKEMEEQGSIVYLGSHYKSAAWLQRQQFSDEQVARQPFLTNEDQRTRQQQVARLAKLARSDADRFAPAEESVRSLGDLTGGQSVPDSQS